MSDLSSVRLGYVPCAADHSAPGDRRRFAHWAAARGVWLAHPSPGDDLDLVVLSARADISRWAAEPRGRTRLAYDLVDSYLAVRQRSPADLARGMGKSLLRQHRRWTPSFTSAVIAMCRRADAVICSTPEQRETISRYCGDVRVILDIHEQELVPAPRPASDDGVLRLLWEGLPDNLTGFHDALSPALAQLHQEQPVELHIVTDETSARWLGRVGRHRTRDALAALPVPALLHPWSTGALVSVAGACHAGIIPLALDNAFAMGKPENKLLLMWRLGLPVVTSATPAYRRVMRAAGHDLTCTTAQDWAVVLRSLRDDPALREQVAREGRRYLELHHTRDSLLTAWDQIVDDLLGRAEHLRSAVG